MLPAEIAQAVKRIQFITGRQVSDVMAGAYLSVFKGRGMEFDEVRPYVPGDDIRAIDWNVTARTGEPHIKRFVEERELTVMLLVDVSASQDFGSGRRSKLEAAVELSALLALSAVENGDKVGMLLFHGGADLYIPPRKGGKHALRIVREVLARGQGIAEGPAKRPVLPAFVRKWFAKLQRGTRPGGAAARQQTLKADLRATGMDLATSDASQSMVDPLLRFFRERVRRLR